ncbi:TPA: signal recognition particle protein Srp19 [Candidatus Bathyarchaeota archaeon]|nr:signal recognition particle protein Srp19 [Candidatus Bathyarchaeota archaeon]
MRKPGRAVVWPANIDAKKTRGKGRKISIGSAVEAPRLEEVVEAAARLGLSPIPVPHSALPREWWNKTGYVIIERKGKGKIQVLRELASEVAKARKTKS